MEQMARPIILLGWLLPFQALAADPPGPAIALDSVTLDASKLRVHFIDIGPGLAVLIETPNDRRHIFVDGGKWGLADMSEYVSRFVPTTTPIDIAIVTHADSDHYKGMKRIFDTYDVRSFWYTGYTSTTLSGLPTWTGFLQQVDDEEGCAVYSPISNWVSAGDTEVIDDGGTADTQDDIVVQYLNVDSNPPERGPIFGRSFDEGERRNNASLVFKLVYKDVSFLFTGDINGRRKEHESASTDDEIDSEELELWVRHQLDAKYSLKATVLQAPHHGSNGSCSLRFIQAVDPEWVVITAGHQFNHPHPAALRRFATAGIEASHVLRTDEGDSTPEVSSVRDPRGDDCYVFETDGVTVTRILRVRVGG
ncbi:MAG: MBL fold metallo-hydrolase [Planctomycetes bacterium]|nr:MBL fold metallo-hydrolase [Planctomycetota bacterium]